MLDINKNIQENIDVNQLSKHSNKIINCICDYCGCQFTKKFSKYNLGHKTVAKDSCNSQDCMNKKRTDSNMVKFGGPSAMSDPNKLSKFNTNKSSGKDHAEKIKKGVQAKYGVDNVFQAKEIKEKTKITTQEKYGVDHIMHSDEIKNKLKQSFTEKYGVDCALKVPKFKEKAKQTNLERYGVTSYAQTDEFKIFMKNFNQKYNGKSLKELAEESDLAYTTFAQKVKKYGIDIAITATKKISGIELLIKKMLDKNNLIYQQHKYLKGYIPDFIVNNIIIEVDGLYWHSDKICENTKYHMQKRRFYIDNGYYPLFFREHEILEKLPIIESIILNKLNLTKTKIFARKTEITKVDKDLAKPYWNNNHLMGNGQGQTYGLKFNNEIVAAIQIINRKSGIEISRFANVLNTNVIGGFSKLLNHVEKIYLPYFVINFVDLRYGSGHYLDKLGFQKLTEHLSFNWTDFKKCFHRLKFKGNSGYKHNLAKIWDCGQAKYVKYN